MKKNNQMAEISPKCEKIHSAKKLFSLQKRQLRGIDADFEI
jgi:hypothetical protein